MASHVARATRFNIRLSAELLVDGRLITGVTQNLSTGGVCLAIDRPIAERSSVKLKLFVVEDGVEAEGARGLDLSGTVQWAAEADRGWTVGLKFGALTADQTAALARALAAVGNSG